MRYKEGDTPIDQIGQELDPFNPLFQSLYGVDLLLVRRYDEALEQFQKVLKIMPDNEFALHKVAIIYLQKGMAEECVEALKAYFNAFDFDEGVEALVQGYEESGVSGAMNRAAKIMEQFDVIPKKYWSIADLYIFAGNKQKSLDMLELGFLIYNIYQKLNIQNRIELINLIRKQS